jgi:eukaryotic-like serine/threonine-protein kinase
MGQDLRPRDGGEFPTRRRIDAACDRFEVAWRAGASPRIEDYLADWSQPGRNELFFELLGVELELRLEAGEDPTLDDYRARFPELVTVTDAVLIGSPDDRPAVGPMKDRMPPAPFLSRCDGPLEPIDLFRITTWEEARERPGDFLEPTTHSPPTPTSRPTGTATELMPGTPDLKALTATDLRNALAALTEWMSGDWQRPPDRGTTTLADPDTTLQSQILEPTAITDQAIPDPARRDLEATVGLGSHPVPPARERTGTSPAARPSIPGYDLLEKLGEGGMGVVYKARQVALNRLVAVKMIRGDGDGRPDQVARIRIEAESIARLRHPHILQIHNTGIVGDCPFLALELLDGGSLADRLAHTPQPGRSSAELLVTLARAIHAAHQAGIVHRDLKPSNVLFTSNGIPKISDFGLAKQLESHSVETQSGLIMGSPSYMAPEQARGHTKNVGPPADVYSLGAIFYEMLTGRPPFKGETPMETVRQVTDTDPVPPSRLVPRLPRDLETICLKCLSKEAHQRYDSASDLADDLERYLRGEAIKARSTQLWERGVKWARRRPTLATLMGLGLLATLTLIAAGSWLVRREGLRVEHLRREVVPSLLIGQALLAKEKWGDATEHIIKAHTQTRNEPQLVELHRQAAALLDQAERGRAEQEARDADQAVRDADQERYHEFLRLRDEALIHDTQFTGLDALGDLGETRRGARAALAIFAGREPGDDRAPSALPASLSPSQRDEIRSGCYALLLVLAEAAERPEQGLRLLDEAARLHPPTRAYHLRRGACLARTGDAQGAERERRAADRVPTTTAFDHFLAGQERYRRRDWIGAKQQFDAALQLQPDDFWSNCLSAISGLQLRQPLTARAELIACLQMKPDLPWLYILRGLASQQAAMLARSTAETSPAGDSPSPADVPDLLDDARADFDKALELVDRHPNADLRYQALVNRGLLWLARRDWDKAEADLRSAIASNADQYLAYEALAQVRWRQDRPDAAIAEFSRAIALRPDWAPLYRARADVELGRKDPTPAQQARALDDVERAIRLSSPDDPVRARDYTTRGRLLHLGRRDTDALAACETALKLVPNYADAHRLRLDILLATKRWDEVIRSCDALLAQGNPSAALYELRSLARAGRQDYAGAIQDDTEALTLSPDSVPLLVRRGWLYLVADAPRLAAGDFDEAIRLDGSSAEAHLGRGTARVRLGQHRAGVDDVETALRLGKPTPQMGYNAARVLCLAAVAAASEVRKKGHDAVAPVNQDEDRALALLREALKLFPADQRATFVGEVLNDPALAVIRRRLRSVLSVSPSGSRPKS